MQRVLVYPGKKMLKIILLVSMFCLSSNVVFAQQKISPSSTDSVVNVKNDKNILTIPTGAISQCIKPTAPCVGTGMFFNQSICCRPSVCRR